MPQWRERRLHGVPPAVLSYGSPRRLCNYGLLNMIRGGGMFRKIWMAATAAILVCMGASAAPLEAYGMLPTLTNMPLSPDGASIAYVRPYKEKRVVIAQNVSTKAVLGIIDATNRKVRDLQWADNHTLIITTSVTTRPNGFIGNKQEYYMAQTFDVATKEQRALMDHISGISGIEDVEVMNVVAGVPQARIIDGHTVLFVRGIYFPSNKGCYGLFRIDLTTGSTRMISRPRDTHTEDWTINSHGDIVAMSGYWEDTQHWKLFVYRDEQKIQLLDLPASIEQPEVEGLNEDETALIVATPDADGTLTYQQYSLKDGKASPWAHADVDFGNVITELGTGRVVGGTRVSDIHDYVYFDAHADKMWRSVKGAFKGATDVDLESWSDDHTKVLAHVFGAEYGEGFFYVDMIQHKAIPFGAAYSDINEVAPERWIEYKAADGRGLHAYLTVPIGQEAAKNLPLIVLPHGGPHSRDEPGFDWMSQALAARGYVVLQPQFRGSSGFGMELLSAGFGEFGKKMQTDLSDGVRALAAQGLIDPKRVCIAGASYGGYAALAGATLDTGVYRCAVSIAGISDLRGLLRFWNWPRGSDDRNQRFWDRFLGVTDYDDPKLKDISPIKHIDKVTIPILLIHGKDDTVVNFDQSDDMADELKDAKKPYEFVVLKGEDHWLSKSETRLQMLQAMVKFLETHNPPNPPAEAPVAATK